MYDSVYMRIIKKIHGHLSCFPDIILHPRKKTNIPAKKIKKIFVHDNFYPWLLFTNNEF